VLQRVNPLPLQRGWYSAGACHTQKTTALISQALAGRAISRTSAFNPPSRARPPAALLNAAGRPNNSAGSGRLSTISGAAASTSSMCCSMCTQNSSPANPSSGETSASAVTSSPAVKARACLRSRFRFRPLRYSLRQPAR